METSKKGFYFRGKITFFDTTPMKNSVFATCVAWLLWLPVCGQSLEALLAKCDQFTSSGQLDSVRRTSLMIRELAIKADEPVGLHRAEYFLGMSLVRTYPDSAYRLLKKSQGYFLKTSDNKYLSKACNTLGNYYAQKGDKKEAIGYYLQAKEYAEKYYTTHETAKYPRMMAIFHHNIATIYVEMTDYKKAQENSLKALQLANQHGLKDIEALALVAIGNIEFELRQDDEAAKYFKEALGMFTAPAVMGRKGVVLNNLGNIYMRKVALAHSVPKPMTKETVQHFQTAKSYYQQALQIAQQQNDYPSISLRLNNLSNLEIIRENYAASEKYLLQALEYAEKAQSKPAKMRALANLALGYVKTDQIPRAIEKANIAVALSKDINDPEVLPKLYNTLEQAYAKQRDFAKALEFQKIKVQSKDSLYRVETTAAIAELQTQYETEKKQRTIELLTAQNRAKTAEIKQKNYFIVATAAVGLLLLGGLYFLYRQRVLQQKQQTAEMKQRLLRAQLNPHFLFNCLNSIQRLYVEGKMSLANDFIADFAQLMRDILEKTGRTTIPLYEEMEFIEAYLSLEKRRLGDKFDYEIIMNEEIRNSDIEVPSFIVQPLVENALLHGVLPKNVKGKIEVLVNQLPNESLSITVKDDGVGFYQSMKNAGKHTSKGMELIKSRLGKQGKMLIEEVKNLNQEILGTKVELLIAAP